MLNDCVTIDKIHCWSSKCRAYISLILRMSVRNVPLLKNLLHVIGCRLCYFFFFFPCCEFESTGHMIHPRGPKRPNVAMVCCDKPWPHLAFFLDFWVKRLFVCSFLCLYQRCAYRISLRRAFNSATRLSRSVFSIERAWTLIFGQRPEFDAFR